MVEPAANLQVTEIASKSMRVTWDPSLGEITGYKLTLIPMLAGMKRQVLYIGPTQTSINVRDLSPETEYEINLYALKGLTPSEPIVAMEKTQPVKVSTGMRIWILYFIYLEIVLFYSEPLFQDESLLLTHCVLPFTRMLSGSGCAGRRGPTG